MAGFAIWNKCNNNCLMCTNPLDFRPNDRSDAYSSDKVFSRIKKWSEENKFSKENINLTGGEPTLHPHFLDLLAKIRKFYPENRIVLISNGRMFSYPKFAKRCLETKDLTLEISLHASTAKRHDLITKTNGSFIQTVRGIKNILACKKPSQEVEIRVVISKLNCEDTEKTVKFIKKNFPGVDRIILIFLEMEGSAEKNLKQVGLTYKEYTKYLSLKKLKKWSNELPEPIRLYHFPLCVLPFQLWKYAWRTLDEREIVFLEKCKFCPYKKYCLGIPRDYPRLIGEQEFRPIKRKIKVQPQKNFHHPIKEVKE